MNFNINSLKSYALNLLKPQTASKEELLRTLKTNSKERISYKLTKYREFRSEMEQGNLKNALAVAEDTILPDRRLIYGIYKETMRDPHVLSQIRTQNLKITGSPWAIFDQGTDNIDEDMTRLFQKRWFEKYRDYYHITKYWGHSLIEFGAMVDTSNPKKAESEFKDVKIIPREHVKPETGEILLDLSHQSGIPYREEPWNEWIIEIGDTYDLGLLLIIAKEVIWKNYSRSDWSRFSEKFGMPILVMKTGTKNDTELKEIDEMMMNFGTNLWARLDDSDEFEIKERLHTKGHEVYIDKIKYCDSMIAKLISGQEGTSEQKAFVGAAEVHERILNEYVEAGQREETYHNNSELFPFLQKHGYKLEGKEFRYLAFQHDEDEANNGYQKDDKSKDPPKTPPKDEGGTANFTEPSAQVSAEGVGMTFTARVNGLYHSCCQTLSAELQLTDLAKHASNAADRVFDKKLSGRGIDKKLWQETVSQLIDGIDSGYGRSISGVKYGSPDHQLLLQYRYNVQVFAAFKNHHNTNELVNALVDENGNIRSKSAFKKAAGLVNSKYNNWISTEYNQAVLAARNGYRWQRIEERSHIFPTVEYVGVADDNQSQICKDLDGGVWRWDDPILDTIAPSNHWGCRSFLKSSKKDPAPKTSGEEVKPSFRNNPGKTGDPFSAAHPYKTVQAQYQDAAQRLFGITSLITHNLDRFRSNVKQLELLDGKQHKIQTYKESGGFVATHKNADVRDLATNSKAAEVLAKDKGHGVIIREHVEDGTPNPELMVNEVLSDVKSPKTPYSLDSRLQRAVDRQQLNNVVWSVKGTPSLADMAKGLRRGFHNRKGIDFVDVVYKDKTLRVTREMFERGMILNEMELVWK